MHSKYCCCVIGGGGGGDDDDNGTVACSNANERRRPYTVLIEGNIGSGKTTFLKHFIEKYSDDFCIITEPLDKWCNLNGVNLLESMYSNPKQWAMAFQSYVMLTMLQGHEMQTSKRVKLMERSIFSTKCFVDHMYRDGLMEDGMYYVLQEWYKFIDQRMPVQADLIIYLRTSPEVAYERVRRRANFEENSITLEYLEGLHEAHDNWLLNNDQQCINNINNGNNNNNNNNNNNSPTTSTFNNNSPTTSTFNNNSPTTPTFNSTITNINKTKLIVLNADMDIKQLIAEYDFCKQKILSNVAEIETKGLEQHMKKQTLDVENK